MQHVFLIGPSGDEKQAIGHILAQRLDRPLLDVDALIEEESGERIQAILARHGEGYFREHAGRVMKTSIETEQGAIVAVSSDAVEHLNDAILIAENDVAVYLYDDIPAHLWTQQEAT